jgi:uncharacterized membrane protein YqiK
MSDTSIPGAGHNEAPDYAQTITATLQKDYAELVKGAGDLLEEARALPASIPDGDESTLNTFTTLIKRMRDTTSRITTFHVTEKEPHLRAGQAVDQFFFRLHERLARRSNKDKPGAADILQARVGDFLERKRIAEQKIRDEAERAARAEAERIRNEQIAAARAAEEAAAKAARARNAANIAAHAAEAERQRKLAEEARKLQEAADQAAEDARIDATAKPADLVRTRTEGGAIATLRQVPLVKIEDVSKLDKELLWPFLKDEHILMALKAWAKTKSHKVPMAGATIKMVNEGAVI